MSTKNLFIFVFLSILFTTSCFAASSRVKVDSSYATVDYLNSIESGRNAPALRDAVHIERGKVYVDSKTYPELNQPANITFYGITAKKPYLVRDGVPQPHVKLYQIDATTYSFIADHFSTWGILDADFNAIGIYSQNENSTQDYSPVGNDGTLTGNAFWNVSSDPSGTHGSFQFDGSGDFIELNQQIPTFANTTTPLPFSVSGWIRSDAVSGCQATWGCGIVSHRTSDAIGDWVFSVSNNGRLMFHLYQNAGNDADGVGYTNTGLIASDKWYHFAGTWNGSDKILYINGSNYSITGTDGTSAGWGAIKAIGYQFGGAGYYWDGRIDDLVIYNRSLSASEVEQIYEKSTITTQNITPNFVKSNTTVFGNATTFTDVYINASAFVKWYRRGVLVFEDFISGINDSSPIQSNYTGTKFVNDAIWYTVQLNNSGTLGDINTSAYVNVSDRGYWNATKKNVSTKVGNLTLEPWAWSILASTSNNVTENSTFIRNITADGITIDTTGGPMGEGHIVFDGDDDNITIHEFDNEFGFNGTQQYAVFMNIKWAGSAAAAEALVAGRDGGFGWIMQVRGSTGFPDFFINDGSNRNCIATDGSINDTEWHTLIFDYDGAARNIYVDGGLVRQCAGVFSYHADVQTTVGTTATASNFTGNLSGIKFFNHSLSAEERSWLNRSMYGKYMPNGTYFTSPSNISDYNNQSQVNLSFTGELTNLSVSIASSDDCDTLGAYVPATKVGNVYEGNLSGTCWAANLSGYSDSASTFNLYEMNYTTGGNRSVAAGGGAGDCGCPGTPQNWEVGFVDGLCELTTECNMGGFNITFPQDTFGNWTVKGKVSGTVIPPQGQGRIYVQLGEGGYLTG